VEGLTGLIVLGNAWESLDVFYALQAVLAYQNKGSLVALVRARCRELQDQGKKSLDPNVTSAAELREAVSVDRFWRNTTYTADQLNEVYHRLRTEAEEYQTKRTAYMMERLKAGRHPDIDATFWDEWHDPGPPPPVPYNLWEKKGNALMLLAVAALLSLPVLRSRTIRRRI
jgi:hypothetical protein